MTFRQREYRSPLPHLTLVLHRLQYEQATGVHKTSSFTALCDMVFVPYDLRKRLLQTMVDAGYVIDEGKGQIRITPLGIQSAA